VQPRVHDLEPRVAQRARDDLRAAVVTVQTGLGDEDAMATGHDVMLADRPGGSV
jgi:hypothetical protein